MTTNYTRPICLVSKIKFRHDIFSEIPCMVILPHQYHVVNEYFGIFFLNGFSLFQLHFFLFNIFVQAERGKIIKAAVTGVILILFL